MEEMTWKYDGAGEAFVPFPNQVDWNQTLITKINQCGASFYKVPTAAKETHSNAANKLLVSENLRPVFESLEFYNKTASILSGRFDVEFTVDSENEIIMIRLNDDFKKKIKVI